MNSSISFAFAPLVVFGGDVAERVTNGSIEGAGSQSPAGVAPGWIISQTPGHGVSGYINTATVHGGLSAQAVAFSATANEQQAWAQQINGLDTNNTYGASAWIQLQNLSSSQQHTVVFRVGPNSAAQSYQSSATATTTASYQLLELSWSNTASSVWLWVSDVVSPIVNKVNNGDMESFSSGVATGWIKHASITASSSGEVNSGVSSQQLSFSSNTDGTQSIAQQLTGLSANTRYGLSGFVKISSPKATAEHLITLRVGTNSGAANWQATATVPDTASAGFQQVALEWSNTASSVWIWLTSTTAGAGPVILFDTVSSAYRRVSSTALIDDVSLRSSSANTMDSNTASNILFSGYSDWSLTVPNGVATVASGTPFILQVNNANSLDPNKARHYVNPIAQAIRSTSDVNRGDQFSASAADFEANWIDYGTITASAHVGAGNFRFLRVKNLGGFTGAASAFKAYFFSYGMIPMV